MDYERLVAFVARHGNVAVLDTFGATHSVGGRAANIGELVENADRFLWDGEWRSAQEMEDLVAQSERGLRPGCADCDRLERALIDARDRDRLESNLDGKYELPALHAFQDHRQSHG